MNLNRKKSSIFKIILLPFIVIMIGQALLFYLVTLWGGAIDELRDNAFESLDQKVLSRKNDIERELVGKSYSLQEAHQLVVALLEQEVELLGVHPESLLFDKNAVSSLLLQCSDTILYALKKSGATGAFIVLDQPAPFSATEISYPSIYIRDLDPISTTIDNSDLVLRRGSTEVYRHLNITTDVSWMPYDIFPSQPNEDYNFYFEPLRAGQGNPDVPSQDLGYWSAPFQTKYMSAPVLTYTMPLKLSDGTTCGVIGFDLSAESLKKILPYRELTPNMEGSYLLGPLLDHSLSARKSIVSGLYFNRVLEAEDQIPLEAIGTYENSYRVVMGEFPLTLASMHTLNLYNTNVPYQDTQWALAGFVEERSLLAAAYRMSSVLLISAILSILFGIACVVIISRTITYPIEALAKRLKSSRSQFPLSIEKINIQEIDQLSFAISDLSLRVAESASKLSRIIRLADIPIGAFEYTAEDSRVFFTDNFFSLMGIHDVSELVCEDSYTTATEFERFTKSLPLQIEERNNNSRLFRVGDNTGQTEWVKLTLVKDSEKTLGVIVNVTQDIMVKHQLEYERNYDVLTGLLNRRAFTENIERLFCTPEKLGIAALIMLDVDNLKYINDTYGHDWGDEYLRCAGSALKALESPKTLVSRISGDEFFVFIFGYETKEQVRDVMEQLKGAIGCAAITTPDQEHLRLRASAGVAWYSDDADTATTLMHYADYTMYTVKRTTKGQMGEFDILNYNKNSYLLKASEEFNKFVDGQLAEYFFQPIVDVKTGGIYAYEALIRSRMKTLRSPFEILSLAKEQSRQYEIEKITYFIALRDFVSLGFSQTDCHLFINSISNQFLSPQDIVAFEALYQPYLSRLVVEITEDEKLDVEIMKKKNALIAHWGGQTALDDFGTGYNGDMALLTLSPQYVKMDMTIVRGIDSDPSRQRVFKNWVSYCHERKIKLIAEGIETKEELETIIRLGADYLQGYFLGMPQRYPQSVNPEALAIVHALAQGGAFNTFE